MIHFVSFYFSSFGVFLVKIGFEYYVEEPQQPKRKPKNYASTFGRNGVPQKWLRQKIYRYIIQLTF